MKATVSVFFYFCLPSLKRASFAFGGQSVALYPIQQALADLVMVVMLTALGQLLMVSALAQVQFSRDFCLGRSFELVLLFSVVGFQHKKRELDGSLTCYRRPVS